MKKTTPLPDGAPVVFDQAKAVLMKPAYRHEPTARTVGFEQDLGDGRKALFSPTFQFISVEDGAAAIPAPEPSQEPAA